jgi:hypothetical protein
MGAGSAATTSMRKRVPTDGDITTATAGPVAIQGIVVLRGMSSDPVPHRTSRNVKIQQHARPDSISTTDANNVATISRRKTARRAGSGTTETAARAAEASISTTTVTEVKGERMEQLIELRSKTPN